MNVRDFEQYSPNIHTSVYVDPAAVVIGAVSVGQDSSIWPCVVIRGDVEHITIGERSSIQDGAVVHVTHDGPYSPGGRACVVGDDVTVGHKALLHACVIGNRCLIGMGAIVMDGAVIEDDVLLAAGAMVPPGKRLASGYLYRGAPAVQVRPLTQKEYAMLIYSAANYVKVKNRHQAQLDA